MTTPSPTLQERRARHIDQAINLLRTTGGAGGYTTISGTAKTLTAEQVVAAAKILERYVRGQDD